MSSQRKGKPPTVTKMQHAYWEAKQAFSKSLGNKEDSCIISSDAELDSKLHLLQDADNSFNLLMKTLLKFREALQKFVDAEDALGMALLGYGTKDSTTAGGLMTISGDAICQIAQRQSALKAMIMKLYHEVQTFQFKATSDALQTVTKMEKVRRSYRSGLMWMKNESTDLDPDVASKMRNFRRVQEHIKSLKVRFDGVKLETMQKIDLFLLSRINLFSQTLVLYRKVFCRMSKHSTYAADLALFNFPQYISYKYETVKELNQLSKKLSRTIQLQIPKWALKRHEIPGLSHSVYPVRKNKTKTITPDKKCSHNANIHCSQRKARSRDRNDDAHARENALKNTEHTDIENTKLINLDEDTNIKNSSVNFPPSKGSDVESTRYSDDLLSLDFFDQQAGDSRTHVTQTNNFFNEFEDCMNQFEINELKHNEPDYTQLHFWSIIEAFGTKQENNNRSQENVVESSVEENDASKMLPVSQWEDMLIDFDPLSNNKSQLKCKNAHRNC